MTNDDEPGGDIIDAIPVQVVGPDEDGITDDNAIRINSQTLSSALVTLGANVAAETFDDHQAGINYVPLSMVIGFRHGLPVCSQIACPESISPPLLAALISQFHENLLRTGDHQPPSGSKPN